MNNQWNNWSNLCTIRWFHGEFTLKNTRKIFGGHTEVVKVGRTA